MTAGSGTGSYGADGSTDQTGAILRELAEDRPQQIEVFSLERNAGKAEAVRRGLLEALRSSSQRVEFWDAEL